jgi:hypothetical protein
MDSNGTEVFRDNTPQIAPRSAARDFRPALRFVLDREMSAISRQVRTECLPMPAGTDDWQVHVHDIRHSMVFRRSC